MHKLSPPAQEGWAIHIYSRDRNLLCSLEPSHLWAFAAGAALGLLVAVIGYNLPSAPLPTAPVPPPADFTAPLQID
ncbi:MAG: hypothetical protein DCF21_07555 [Leptolyngbya sp.]|jgi:hypothetical protein|uniref:Uncharacterized protein n=1 Tax=Shackletoniella antarctica TaxID=268115 RepID=A0A2W4Y8R5_9CYAN|nr:MAG: hypothetical protein DCF17_13070 [Shackletoniella antarctica]PZV19275.1 MAG: hypothetical protein DCF21_07555 [Leptolyngbya sp.]